MHLRTSITAALLFIATIASPLGKPAVAQLVDVRPGYVRAPFVRVYSYPDGSSHVRAPFVSVYSPPRVFVTPSPYFYSESRVTEYADDLSNLDWRVLRQRIRDGVARFDRNLARAAAYAEWRDYLKTDILAGLVADDNDDPPRPAEADQLQEILSKYQATVNSSNLQRVTTTDGFRTVYDALVKFVTPPLERQRQLLDRATRQLRDDLSGISAPASWHSFLRVPQNMMDQSEGDATPSPDMAAGGMEALQKTLSRYEQVSQDPHYRAIAELPGFRATQELLKKYLMQIWPVGDVEELPAPNSEDRTESPVKPQP